MKSRLNKTRSFHTQTLVILPLLSAACIGSVTAAPQPGHWQGGAPGTNDPYWVCLNVSPDGKFLTAQNTKCRGDQGQNQNSIDIQFQSGQTPEGARCNQYSYRNLEFGDIAIKADGTFSTNFTNAFINTTITGTFTDQKVTGTAQSISGSTVKSTGRPPRSSRGMRRNYIARACTGPPVDAGENAYTLGGGTVPTHVNR